MPPLEIITGRPMILDQRMYELALMKADLLIYWEELIRAPKTNSSWSNHSICHSQEMKIYSIMISNPKIMSIGNTISIKMAFSPNGKNHIKYYILILMLLNLRALTHAFTYLS